MDPTLECVTLWRDREYLNRFEGRQDLIDYATEHGIPVKQTKEVDGGASFSTDENLMHISYESGVLEAPHYPGHTGEYPEEMWVKTRAIEDTPDTPVNITIEFTKGLPTKCINVDDGTVHTDALEMFMYLNDIGGEHGVGRLDIVENRFIVRTDLSRFSNSSSEHARSLPLLTLPRSWYDTTGHEVSRLLRDTGWQDPLRRPPRPGDPDPRPRGHAAA